MSWQDALLTGLRERDGREKVYADIIENYRRLAQSTVLLKERNQILLKATATAKASGSGQSNGEDNPVRAAYVTSLESQINSLREEIGQLYKTQGQNAQRLLTLSETLRETEERSRDEQTQLRTLLLQNEKLLRQNGDASDSAKEKEKVIQHLNDELATANLEYTQLEKRNLDLQKDNKSLLQRWLDRMNAEVTQVNDANAFIESTGRLRAGQENATANTAKTTTSRPSSRPASPTRSSSLKKEPKEGSTSGRRTPTSIKSKFTSSKSKSPAPPEVPKA